MQLKATILFILFTITEFAFSIPSQAQLSKGLLNFLPNDYKPNPTNKAALSVKEMMKIFHYAEAYVTPQVATELDSLGSVFASDTLTENNDSLCIEIFRRLTAYSMNANNFDAALKYSAATLRRLNNKKEYKTLLYSSEKIMGAIYAGLGNYEQSIRYFNECLDNAKAEKDSIGIAEIYSGLSYPYAILGLYEYSLTNLDSSIAYFGNLKETDPYFPELEDVRVSRCGRYINLYEKSGKSVYGQKAMAIINVAETKKNHHYLYDVFPVGIAYFDRDYKQALFLCDSLLAKISLQNPPHKDAMINYINKYQALIFLNTKKNAAAGISILKQFINLYCAQKKANGSAYANVILFSNSLYKYYKSHQQWKEAFAYLEMNKNYNDSLHLLENRGRIFEQQQDYDFSKKEEQLAKLENSNIIRRKERDFAIYISAFLLLCMGLTALLSYHINHKLKLKKLVADKEAELKLEKLQITSQFQIAEIEERNTITKLQEQKKLGMELHDDIAANLACIAVRLNVEKENCHNKKLHDHLEELNMLVSEVYDAVREKSHQLYGMHSKVTNSFFAKKITDLLNTGLPANRYETEVLIDKNSLHEISLAVKIEFLYIIREALANILKHAHAKKISILIYRDLAGLIMEISDDGKGFDTSLKNNGMGLHSIKTRAETIGGNALINSGKEGTTVKIIVPEHTSLSMN